MFSSPQVGTGFLASPLSVLLLLSSAVLWMGMVQAQGDEVVPPTSKISNAYKYASHLWPSRNLQGNSSLNFEEFDSTLQEISDLLCDLGITATVFDSSSSMVYQKTVGNAYYGFNDAYLDHTNYQPTGWTGDTEMAIYSNSKILGVLTFMASVVDAGLGYLDEPLHRIFPDLIDCEDMTGTVTPRMLMSHTSGLAKYNRNDPTGDPYYSCIYNETKAFEECLREHLFDPSTLVSDPGSTTAYNNEPFDILAAIVVRKTGASNYGEALKLFLTEPLGMNNTSMDCDVTQSTSDKPHIAWGVCSTANDMAKLVQLLGSNGKTPTGETVVSPFSMQQIFSTGTGVATNADGMILGGGAFAFSRCYSTLQNNPALQPNSISGYGLGTMFMPGTKGQWFTHAGSKGGYWAVAPGRFSAYFGWQDNAPYPAYTTVASLLDTLELSSSFSVSRYMDANGSDPQWEEIEDICGGDLYIDWYAVAGIDSIRNVTDHPCGTDRRLGSKKAVNTKDGKWRQEMEETMHQL